LKNLKYFWYPTIPTVIALAITLFMCMNHCSARAEEKEVRTAKIIKTCKACHGKDLKGKKKKKKKIPGIYGESFSVLYIALTSQVPEGMEKIVKKLSKEEAWEVARYISQLDEKPDDERDRE